MISLFKTNAELIRDNSITIVALASGQKADGAPFTYREILRAVGLPDTRAMERAVSQYLTDNGGRRVPFRHRGVEPFHIPDIVPESEPSLVDMVEAGEAEIAASAPAVPVPAVADEIRDAFNQAVESLAVAAKHLSDLGEMMDCSAVMDTLRVVLAPEALEGAEP